MEGLIIALILMAIGAAFNRGKNTTPGPEPKGQPRMKRLEDAAKQFQKELQRESHRPERPAGKVRSAAEPVRKPVEQQVIGSRSGREEKGRLTAHQNVPQKRMKITKTDLFPLEKEDVLKGIILAEIFSPPKSKR